MEKHTIKIKDIQNPWISKGIKTSSEQKQNSKSNFLNKRMKSLKELQKLVWKKSNPSKTTIYPY